MIGHTDWPISAVTAVIDLSFATRRAWGSMGTRKSGGSQELGVRELEDKGFAVFVVLRTALFFSSGGGFSLVRAWRPPRFGAGQQLRLEETHHGAGAAVEGHRNPGVRRDHLLEHAAGPGALWLRALGVLPACLPLIRMTVPPTTMRWPCSRSQPWGMSPKSPRPPSGSRRGCSSCGGGSSLVEVLVADALVVLDALFPAGVLVPERRIIALGVGVLAGLVLGRRLADGRRPVVCLPQDLPLQLRGEVAEDRLGLFEAVDFHGHDRKPR